jgi:diaminohydroxyphosphoribosylaminopyrimidine deaminase/5-amino-6-(5-phosphoribosylamino)uracil reductase
VLESECRQLLEGYVTHRTRGLPLVVLKAAITLDGALASESGDSRWISSERSRARGHAMRAEADAVAVGIETVLADDPRLTVRRADGPDPLRVVLDSRLRTPLDCRLITTAREAPLLIAHGLVEPGSAERYRGLTGVETLACAATAEGRVDLRDLLGRLARRGVLSLLVEGGGRVHGAFVEAGLADRFALFVAPKLLGSGLPWIALPARERVEQALAVQDLGAVEVGDDLLIEGRFKPPVWEAE